VDVPPGNDSPTSDKPAAELTAPSVTDTPGSYPFTKVALRGNAGGAARIFVDGAGSPIEADVQPVDGSFCIVVELDVAPAVYTLSLRSQAGDGRLSAPVSVKINRANDAPRPSDATLCDGTPVVQ
jgi:hypothetical protein